MATVRSPIGNPNGPDTHHDTNVSASRPASVRPGDSAGSSSATNPSQDYKQPQGIQQDSREALSHPEEDTFDRLFERLSHKRTDVPHHRASFASTSTELTNSASSTLTSFSDVGQRLSQLLQFAYQTKEQAGKSIKEMEQTQKMSEELIDVAEKAMTDFVKAKEQATSGKEMAKRMVGFVEDMLSWESSAEDEQQRLVQAIRPQIAAWQTEESERKKREAERKMAELKFEMERRAAEERRRRDEEEATRIATEKRLDDERRVLEVKARLAKEQEAVRKEAEEKETRRKKDEEERQDRERMEAAAKLREQISKDKAKELTRQRDAAIANRNGENRPPASQDTSPTPQQERATASRIVSGGVLLSANPVVPVQQTSSSSKAALPSSTNPHPNSRPTLDSSSHVRMETSKSTSSNGFVPAKTDAGREVNTEKPFASTTLASERLVSQTGPERTSSSDQNFKPISASAAQISIESRRVQNDSPSTRDVNSTKRGSTLGPSPNSHSAPVRSADADNVIVKTEPLTEPTLPLTPTTQTPSDPRKRHTPALKVQTHTAVTPLPTSLPAKPIPLRDNGRSLPASRSPSSSRRTIARGSQSQSPAERKHQDSTFFRSERSPDGRQSHKDASGSSSAQVSPTTSVGDGGWSNVHRGPSSLQLSERGVAVSSPHRPPSPLYSDSNRGHRALATTSEDTRARRGDHYSPERRQLSPLPSGKQRGDHWEPDLGHESPSTLSRKRRRAGDDVPSERAYKRITSDQVVPSDYGHYSSPPRAPPLPASHIRRGGDSYRPGRDGSLSPPPSRHVDINRNYTDERLSSGNSFGGNLPSSKSANDSVYQDDYLARNVSGFDRLQQQEYWDQAPQEYQQYSEYNFGNGDDRGAGGAYDEQVEVEHRGHSPLPQAHSPPRPLSLPPARDGSSLLNRMETLQQTNFQTPRKAKHAPGQPRTRKGAQAQVTQHQYNTNGQNLGSGRGGKGKRQQRQQTTGNPGQSTSLIDRMKSNLQSRISESKS
ncbi:uncharacterized protein STEHIDRAFT_125520 [Stereum hirsutum FP-91666 SS1]|uniref:uncharacterized protein n=1 Tax=Stereum hirsutum (strain FP-91666) TaxID=721885 RepID=UPI000444A47B|nr:uncharacterized protein STEHIDRAFT_125520 [Stereum hirsutum FP-91666 SS1]EIM81264.1 hypothetical protein STEHIDRAFT_125520 [Stereum hirsutum FP-91666 SS1]